MTFYKPTKKLKELVAALQTLNDSKEYAFFLRDLLTEPEIDELAGRLAVANALSEGKSQRLVAKETGVSIATVTRVNQWLKRGLGGYALAIKRLKAQGNGETQKTATEKH